MKSGFGALVFLPLSVILAGLGDAAAEAPESCAPSQIVVDSPRVRPPLIAARPGAAFMTIRNRGAGTDSLVGVRTAAAERAEIHGTMADGDIVLMRHLVSVDIAPGGELALRPGGAHIMLMGPDPAMAEMESISLEIEFRCAGRIVIEAPVTKEPRGAR